MSTRRTPMPLLIDAFPTPPSHIPLTPTTLASNPPPSRPPSVPLPPVPGPSRITEADTLQLLLVSNRSTKSRRSSKYSLSPTDGNRDSVLSTSSSGHGVASSPPPNATRQRQRTSLPSSPTPMNRPSIAFSIDEEDEHASTRPLVLRDVVSPMLPISDDDTTDYGNSPRRRRRRHQANESISNIDVRDILGAASGGEDDGPETIARLPLSKSVGSEKSTTTTTTPSNSPPSCRVMTSNPASTSMPHSHKSNLAYLNSDPADRYRPTHSRTLSSSTSISDSTSRNDLASVSTTTLRSSSMANIRASSSSGTFVSTPLTTSPTPKSRKPYNLSSGSSLRGHRSTPAMLTDNARSLSPDIETIIQSTPRPSKTSGGRSFSMSQSGKRSRVTSLRSSRSMKNIHGEVDEFGTLSSSVRLSKSTQDRRPLSSQNPDHSLDYIVQGVWDHQVEEDEEKLRALEKELDGSDSDSSLDLHTPLPHLMARHGLLSSNSKLLSHGESRATTPHCGIDGRPGSTMSVFSNATKSGVIKDERDTPMRRVRHRDKRLLHGGIGLTTGLGWSDSEDEDAPSPLTKRLSTLNLSRRSSASSFFSTASQPHPLSRSYSNGALYDDDGGLGYGFDGPLAEREEEDNLRETSDWAIRQRKITPPSRSNPPTAWQRKNGGASASARNSTASSGGRHSIASSGGRLSIASNGSSFSLEVTSPEDEIRSPSLGRSRARESVSSSGDSTHNRRSAGSLTGTPSTASTLSIPMPATPQQDHQVPSHILTSSTNSTPYTKRTYVDKDKSLPPLPGVLKKTSSNGSSSNGKTGIGSATPTSRLSFPRARTFSNTSSAASAGLSPSAVQSTPAANVRPLQLPRQVRAALKGDRPAVPVPALSSISGRNSLATLTTTGTGVLPTSPRSSQSLLAPRSLTSLSPSPRSLSLSTSNSRPNSQVEGSLPSPGGARPKPRTGTGMVYKRSTSSSTAAPTKVRAPASIGGNSVSMSAVGRVGAIPRNVL